MAEHLWHDHAYFHPQHLFHSFLQPVSQIFMTKLCLRDLFTAFSVLLSKLFLIFSEYSLRVSLVEFLCENSYFFSQKCDTKVQEQLWQRSHTLLLRASCEKGAEREEILTFLGAPKMRWHFLASRKPKCALAMHLPPAVGPEIILCSVYLLVVWSTFLPRPCKCHLLLVQPVSPLEGGTSIAVVGNFEDLVGYGALLFLLTWQCCPLG